MNIEERNQILYEKVFKNIFLLKYITNLNKFYKFNNTTCITKYNSKFINKQKLEKKDEKNTSLQLTSYKDEVSLVYSNIEIPFQKDLLISFKFQIVSKGSCGDGFAIVLFDPIKAGMLLGGHNLGYSGVKGLAAIEFDTYRNDVINDPNDNHISIQGADSNGYLSCNHSHSLGWKSPSIDIKDGKIHSVSIRFHRDSSSFSVSIDSEVDLLSKVHVPSLKDINYSRICITAATGYFYSIQRIYNFEINEL